MTNNSLINSLLVFLVVLVTAGAGYYQTRVAQPQELQHIENQKKLARQQQADLERLFAEEATSEQMAEEITRKWHARYKYIPASMKTPDVLQYLESLSASGFEQFDVSLSSQGQSPDFRFYVFDLSGTASLPSLYRFVWHLENNEAFYQIQDLDLQHTNVFKKNEETGEQRRLDMVNFSMTLKVFYAGTEGLSASTPENPIEVPETLLPSRDVPRDAFIPIVRTDLPPNDELLVDVDNATLVSIAGTRAIFIDKNGRHVVDEGDEVYLGTVVKVDPVNSMVRVSLNRGGNIDIVDVKMEVDPQYRQAQRDDVRLTPIQNQ